MAASPSRSRSTGNIYGVLNQAEITKETDMKTKTDGDSNDSGNPSDGGDLTGDSVTSSASGKEDQHNKDHQDGSEDKINKLCKQVIELQQVLTTTTQRLVDKQEEVVQLVKVT